MWKYRRKSFYRWDLVILPASTACCCPIFYSRNNSDSSFRKTRFYRKKMIKIWKIRWKIPETLYQIINTEQHVHEVWENIRRHRNQLPYALSVRKLPSKKWIRKESDGLVQEQLNAITISVRQKSITQFRKFFWSSRTMNEWKFPAKRKSICLKSNLPLEKHYHASLAM